MLAVDGHDVVDEPILQFHHALVILEGVDYIPITDTRAIVIACFGAQFDKVLGRGSFNLFCPVKPQLQIIFVFDGFQVFIDIVVELIFLRRSHDLFAFYGDEGHCQVEEVVLVLLVDVVVEYLVDQGDRKTSLCWEGYRAKTVIIYWVITIERGTSFDLKI